MSHFFPAEHPSLEAKLEAHFARARNGAESKLGKSATALILGGGYGRGEGGVVTNRNDGTESLFNDLDYFLFTESPDTPSVESWRTIFEKEESKALGIDVEVKALPAKDAHSSINSMMFTDLIHGHYSVWGDPSFLLKLKPNCNPNNLPLIEATRLLWNRGTGLYFARCELERNGEANFIERNLNKLKLALGDAWLILNGKYAPHVRTRAELLDQTNIDSDFEVLKEWHRKGVIFKFQPEVQTRSKEERYADINKLSTVWLKLFLQIETKRLSTQFTVADQYATYSKQLFPGSGIMRNCALAIRDELKRGSHLRPFTDYPRGALMRALVLLLSERQDSNPEKYFSKINGTLETDYLRWWAHYS
ncbi:hypothetical protein [Rubellicoccus peritrichatus]|uniref:Uncharacterized protein n=1 Tax=Rubellicoccus peritrichatus TaxID=3080537 RepID=A0AAQ3QWL6_9BACT|nr:hypothetical protein [Puniceicoccus sp. CR14]WOO42017.1 hypothetical protein RZN69_02875 [Puniceicoccus sp. CR14]